MNSLPVITVVLVCLIALQLVLWGLFLRLGLNWAKVAGVSTRRIVLATLGTHFGAALITFLLFLILSKTPLPGLMLAALFALLELLLVLGVSCTFVAKIFHVSPLRGLLAMAPTLIPAAFMLPLMLLLSRPFTVEAFKVSANSLAPTLVGEHLRGTCPTCGEDAFCSVQLLKWDADDDERYRPPMICTRFHVSPARPKDHKVYSADRMLVTKFVAPRRWDLVAFRFPEAPQVTYVKRLVGLPGETIVIRDGGVWADGQRLTLPADLQGLEYLSEMPGTADYGLELWGTGDRPATLGPDEYFMLGDFSAQSKDSRLWERGAPGHPPYAVPADHLIGVVTHIYWPFQRTRSFR